MSLQIYIAKSRDRCYEDKGPSINNGLGKEFFFFLVANLIQGLKNEKKAAMERVKERTSRDQHLFINLTNIYSVPSVSQEVFKANKIY